MTKNIIHCQRCNLIPVLVLLWAWVHFGVSGFSLGVFGDNDSGLPHSASVRRVNVPRFTTDLKWGESAIFWFGHATSQDNYADVRIAYDNTMLYISVMVVDYYLWYDTDPGDDLSQWDAVTIYLDTEGDGGNMPTAGDYCLTSGLRWWEDNKFYQRAARGDGNGWIASNVPFTSTASARWGGTGYNDNSDDKDAGWETKIYIPFTSLGLPGPPVDGTTWNLAVVLHDRDNATGSPPITDKTWPEDADGNIPSTWGQMVFNPPSYQPPPAVAQGTVVFEHGVNDSVVEDAYVGGGGTCSGGRFGGGDTPHPTDDLFVQHQSDVADFPCFSKSYLRFNIDSLPANKVIISATLTLLQFGNSDPYNGKASLIQLFSIADDWHEATLTWNNAPLATENVSSSWVDVIFPPWNPVYRSWDATQVVAEAYAAGRPLNIALYAADSGYHSGKYFRSSDTGGAYGRPKLTVTYGVPTSTLDKQAWPLVISHDEVVTYTVSILGSGQALTLTDTLPDGLSAPLFVTSTMGDIGYNAGQRRIWWTGLPAISQVVTVTYSAAAQATGPRAIFNTAVLSDTSGIVASDTAVIIVDGYMVFLPLILRSAP